MLASTTLNLASFGSQLLNSPSHNPTKSFLLPPNQPFLKSPNPISSSSFLKSRTTSVRTAVAAVDSSDAAVKEGGEGGSKSYHFVVANAKFMLDEEEHFQELMGERLRLYGERNMEQDFWLVIEPKFLDKFPTITKGLNRPAVALVSTNGPWITIPTSRPKTQSSPGKLKLGPRSSAQTRPKRCCPILEGKQESDWEGIFLEIRVALRTHINRGHGRSGRGIHAFSHSCILCNPNINKSSLTLSPVDVDLSDRTT